MGSKRAAARTEMSVQECAQVFQAAVTKGRGIRSHIGGMAAKVAGSDESGFFTPRDDGPFAALDTDPPAFTIGCNIPKMTNSAAGACNTIHMYVWDRGNHREVEFYSPHGMLGGGSSAKLVRKAISRFQEADPKLDVAALP